jgi:hypothetical protein
VVFNPSKAATKADFIVGFTEASLGLPDSHRNRAHLLLPPSEDPNWRRSLITHMSELLSFRSLPRLLRMYHRDPIIRGTRMERTFPDGTVVIHYVLLIRTDRWFAAIAIDGCFLWEQHHGFDKVETE